MKQAWRALEFVTITSPDEIKDPIKQRAIRRQARRRDNGSKCFSRKPFKMTIDLPGSNIHAGPEQSIMGLQKAGSYYIPPAEHEQSELNAVLPSFDFLPPINNGRGFIFTSPLSPEMNTRVLQLVNFSKNGFRFFFSLWPSSSQNIIYEQNIVTKAVSNISKVRQGGGGKFCPLMHFWWSIGQLDSTAFFVALANASRLISQKHPFEPKESPEAITLYTKSIQSLQKRLQTPVDGLSEGVIVSVLEFAYYDVGKLIIPETLREILINSQVSCPESHPVACPYGWPRKHHSA